MIQEFIDLDKQLDKVFKLSKDRAYLSRGFSPTINGKSVYDMGDKIYKIFGNIQYFYFKASYALIEAFNLSFLAPYEVVYEGSFLNIISMDKLDTNYDYQDKEFLTNFNKPYIFRQNKNEPDLLDYYLYKSYPEDYLEIVEIINFIKISDFILYNCGFDKNHKIKCFDFDIAHSLNNLSIEEFKTFVSKHSRQEIDFNNDMCFLFKAFNN